MRVKNVLNTVRGKHARGVRVSVVDQARGRNGICDTTGPSPSGQRAVLFYQRKAEAAVMAPDVFGGGGGPLIRSR